MATRKNTAPAVAQSVDASPDIQRTIAEAIELVETTQRALEPNEQRASEYGALGQAVAKLWNAHNQVERLPWAAPAHAVPASIARAAAEAPSRAAFLEFDGLLERLSNLVSHLRCADVALFDLQAIPEPLQGACIVLHDAIENLGALHGSMEEWAAKADREARYAGAAEAHDALDAEVPEALAQHAMAALRETVALTKSEQARFRRELTRRLREAP